MKERLDMGRILRSTWVTVGICFLTVFVSLGFCSSGRSLYLTAITGAPDLPRGAFALNDTVRYITTAVVNLFFGVLMLVASGMLVYVLRCAGRDRAAILAAEAAGNGVEQPDSI